MQDREKLVKVSLLPEATIADIWQVNLTAWQAQRDRCWAWLAAEEQQRAAVGSPWVQQRFILGRGLLRLLLSRYLGCPPAALPLTQSDRGKPYLPGQPWYFNLAHSGELLLYAIARHPVGIDVERVRPLAALSLARRWFRPAEAAALAALPPVQQLAAFFATWTRKEACVKATGEGLAALHRVEVSVSPDQPARLLAIADRSDTAANWTLASWQPQPDYWAAVAMLPAARDAIAAPAPPLQLRWHQLIPPDEPIH